MTLRIQTTDHGKGINRLLYDGKTLKATIHHHPRWRREKLPDEWNVCWLTGRVDWHATYTEARDNALKGP